MSPFPQQLGKEPVVHKQTHFHLFRSKGARYEKGTEL